MAPLQVFGNKCAGLVSRGRDLVDVATPFQLGGDGYASVLRRFHLVQLLSMQIPCQQKAPAHIWPICDSL